MQPDAKNTRVVSLETFILVLLCCTAVRSTVAVIIRSKVKLYFFLEQAEPTDLAFKIYIFGGGFIA